MRIAGQLRARLRTWQKQIDADSQLPQTLAQLPVSGWPTEPLAQAPLLAAYLLAHWILAGLQQGQGTMRWTLASRAAKARQALMSSRSRSG